jgi:hypothetical protein
MKESLQSLKEYQDILLRIAELERMLAVVPPEIESLEKEWTAIKDRIGELEQRGGEQESQLSEKQKALEEAERKAKKFEEDLHQVTNTKEYHAALKEIDSAKKQIHTLKEAITSRTKELEEIKANLEECTQLEGESRKVYEEKMAEHRSGMKDNEVELAEKTKSRDKLAKKVPAKMMSRFNRIASRRSGVGLAVCEDGTCLACNVRVRHSVVAELRKYRRLIQCDSCKRILFFAGDVDE